MIGVMKSALENLGIQCKLKNENLSDALGELPFIETWPELWITDDSREKEAISMVENLIKNPAVPNAESWVCISCGETIEGQFSDCWNCGQAKSPLNTGE